VLREDVAWMEQEQPNLRLERGMEFTLLPERRIIAVAAAQSVRSTEAEINLMIRLLLRLKHSKRLGATHFRCSLRR
jgi:hypothetical protein